MCGKSAIGARSGGAVGDFTGKKERRGRRGADTGPICGANMNRTKLNVHVCQHMCNSLCIRTCDVLMCAAMEIMLCNECMSVLASVRPCLHSCIHVGNAFARSHFGVSNWVGVAPTWVFLSCAHVHVLPLQWTMSSCPWPRRSTSPLMSDASVLDSLLRICYYIY